MPKKNYLASLVLFYKDLVDAERARPSGQTKNEWRLGGGLESCDGFDYVVGNIAAGSQGIVANDQSHFCRKCLLQSRGSKENNQSMIGIQV